LRLYTLGEPPRQAVAGVAEEVMQGLRRLGAVTGPQRHRGVFVVFEPRRSSACSTRWRPKRGSTWCCMPS
jgi:hypothetical protein